MFAKTMVAAVALLSTSVFAADIPIIGSVASKCVVYTDTVGVYGNPTVDKLSTARADGGIEPVVRYDVITANTYKAVISTPIEFSSSPTLNDSLAWSGGVSVSKVTDQAMAAYDNDMVSYDNVNEVTLSVAGSTWFKASSEVAYGVGKALPGGTYKALVTAECIAL